MYLFERLVSLAIYVFILFLICYAVSHTGKKDSRRLLNAYILILGIMGYCFIPHTGADLSRLFITMHYYSAGTFSNLIDKLAETGTPGAGLYYFIVGKFNNDQLLPCFSAIITFSLCFYLLKQQLEKKDVKQQYIAAALFLFMSRGLMMQIISGIRTIMALAICAWCIYQEFYNCAKWKKLIIPYVLAASLHVMGQAMLLYRLGYVIVEKGKNPTQKVVRLLYVGVATVLILTFGNQYIVAFFEKADGYYSYARQGTGYSYFWEGVLCVLTLIILICMIISYKKASSFIRKSGLNAEVEVEINATVALINYMLPLIVIDIVAAFLEFNFFLRTNYFFTILMMPLCVQLLKLGELTGNEKTLRNNIIIISIIMLFLACARGDLCSLKFFLF